MKEHEKMSLVDVIYDEYTKHGHFVKNISSYETDYKVENEKRHSTIVFFLWNFRKKKNLRNFFKILITIYTREIQVLFEVVLFREKAI